MLNKLVIILASGILVACNKPEIQKGFEQPSHFPTIEFPSHTPYNQDIVNLGKMLFYDKRLSENNELSCASCHLQNLAFSDGQSLTTVGVSGNKLRRHSPVLFNLAYSPLLFWDGGSVSLERQIFGPLEHPDEMHQDLKELLIELNEDSSYPELFEKTFGDGISTWNIARALAQFERTIISSNSLYDRYLMGDSKVLNEKQLNGLKVVEEKCGHCHKGVLFSDYGFHNNGLDSEWNDHSELDLYLGRFRITADSNDIGKFKTPSLRNLGFTAPYMHDGRFATIEEVLSHYSSGILESPSLDSFLLANKRDFLSETEKELIISFLECLNDSTLVTNPIYQP